MSKLDNLDFVFSKLDGGSVLRVEVFRKSDRQQKDSIGFLHVYRVANKTFEVDQLWVDTSIQRRGVATEMYRIVIEYTRERGEKVVSIQEARTDASNALHEVLRTKFPHERKEYRFGDTADVYSNPPKKWAYHRTEPEYMESICEHGLVPRFGPSLVDPDDGEGGLGDDLSKNWLFFSDHEDRGEHLYGDLVVRFPWPSNAEKWDWGDFVIENTSIPPHVLEMKINDKWMKCTKSRKIASTNPPRDPGARYVDSTWKRASFRQICEALAPVIAENVGAKWPLKVKAATCDQADREHAESDRQYCHVLHKDGVICYSHHIAEVSPNYKLGLAIHEFGHLILDARGDVNHSEQEANDVGGQAAGIRVQWRSDKHLEWSACPTWFKELL